MEYIDVSIMSIYSRMVRSHSLVMIPHSTHSSLKLEVDGENYNMKKAKIILIMI